MQHVENGKIMNNSGKISFLEMFLPFFYILSQYNLTYFSIGFWILFVGACVTFLMKRKIYIQKWLFLFILYVLINQFLFHYTSTDTNAIVGVVLSGFLVFTLSGSINEDNLYKVYSIVGVIMMTAMTMQAFMLFVLKMHVEPIVFFPSLIKDESVWYSLGERPTAFFTEPQAYAAYMMPLLFLALKRRKITFAVLITFTILLSTSSQGIILSFFLWCIYAMKYLKNTGSKIVTIIILTCFISLLFVLPIFDFAVNKILNTDVEVDTRLAKGFITYFSLSGLDQFTGIGYKNLTNYVSGANISLYWMETSPEEGWEYITSVSAAFLYFGLLGGILFLFLFYKMLRYDDKSNLMFLIVIIISSFTQTIMFNQWFEFYYIFYFSLCYKDKANYWAFLLTYEK